MKKIMSKRVLLLISVMVVFALIVAGCSSNSTPPTNEDPKEVEIPRGVLAVGSASSGSLYVTYTAAWADMLMKNIEGLNISVEPGGSSQNMQNIHTGDVEFGITATLQSYPGYYGLGWADGTAYQNINSLFPAYSYEGVFFTRASSTDINSVQDLDGKIIALGYAGGGSDFTGREIMEFFGINPKEIVNGSWTDVGGMLKDGLIDAVFYLAGHPASFIQELELQHELKFITLTDEQFSQFQAAKPFYAVGTLAAGTYKNMPEGYKALQGWNFIVVSPDLSEDFVYLLTKTTWENVLAIHEAHSSFVQTDFNNVKYMNLPLHPGARKYYEENNVELPVLPAPPKN